MCVAASTKSSSVVVVDGQGQRSGPLRRRQSFHYEVSALLKGSSVTSARSRLLTRAEAQAKMSARITAVQDGLLAVAEAVYGRESALSFT